MTSARGKGSTETKPVKTFSFNYPEVPGSIFVAGFWPSLFSLIFLVNKIWHVEKNEVQYNKMVTCRLSSNKGTVRKDE